MSQLAGPHHIFEPPAPPRRASTGRPSEPSDAPRGWKLGIALLFVLVIAARVAIALGNDGSLDGRGNESVAGEVGDGEVARQRNVKSEQTFRADRLADELRQLRDEVGRSERVRNLTILTDGNMAVYTQRGDTFWWIETDGDRARRREMREYPSKVDVDIDLDRVHAIAPRRMLIEAETKFQPRIWKIDALTLGPHPGNPEQLMWTAKWTDPAPLSLYADTEGHGVAKTYPPVS